MKETILQAETVLLSLDQDDAGRNASQWWLQNVPQIKLYPLPQKLGKDMTEAFLAGMDLQGWIHFAPEYYQRLAKLAA